MNKYSQQTEKLVKVLSEVQREMCSKRKKLQSGVMGDFFSDEFKGCFDGCARMETWDCNFYDPLKYEFFIAYYKNLNTYILRIVEPNGSMVFNYNCRSIKTLKKRLIEETDKRFMA